MRQLVATSRGGARGLPWLRPPKVAGPLTGRQPDDRDRFSLVEVDVVPGLAQGEADVVGEKGDRGVLRGLILLCRPWNRIACGIDDPVERELLGVGVVTHLHRADHRTSIPQDEPELGVFAFTRLEDVDVVALAARSHLRRSTTT